MIKKKVQNEEKESSVCEDINGFRYTKFKSMELAQNQLLEYKAIGVMDDKFHAYQCDDCKKFHIGKKR